MSHFLLRGMRRHTDIFVIFGPLLNPAWHFMKKWKQKAIVQKAISYLPYPQRINFLFQKYVTRGVQLTDHYFFDRLQHARNHISAWRKSSGDRVPQSTLELGTGWYPIVPVTMFLLGAGKIYSVDISQLTSRKRLLLTLQRFTQAEENNTLAEYVSWRPERMAVIHEMLRNPDPLSLEQMLARLHIHYLLEDARSISLRDGSIDLVHSNNTFEHIYPDILRSILAEFKRIVRKPGGVMSHFVDMTDHFAHFDPSINVYHFLRFSERQWRWIDNGIQPQNRLRADDYLGLYADLDIPVTNEDCRPGDVEALRTIPLAAQFREKPLSVIARTHCHYRSAF